MKVGFSGLILLRATLALIPIDDPKVRTQMYCGKRGGGGDTPMPYCAPDCNVGQCLIINNLARMSVIRNITSFCL